MDVLSEIIECSVCLERMDTKSRVLPCQHTFCSDCLHRIAIQNKNELKCPECRYICTIPVRNLPANILLVRLLEGLKNAGKSISSKRELLREAGKACAEAMYSYEPQEQGDLGFRRGDLIYLKKKLDENWYVGESDGKCGYLPATYVKVICPLRQSKPYQVSNGMKSSTVNSSSNSVESHNTRITVKALYDFEMKDEDKEDCLKFKKDDHIELIRKVDDNWAEGRIAGAVGIFPLNYVRVTESARVVLDTPPPYHSRVLPVTNKVSKMRSRNISEPATVYTSRSAACVDNNSTRLEPSGTKLVRAEPLTADRDGASSTAVASIAAVSEPRKYISVPSSSNNTSQDQKTSSSVPTESLLKGGTKESEVAAVRSRSSDGVVGSESSARVPSKLSLHNVYRAMYNYKPQKDDEISLTRGSLYHVTDRCKDGWYRGYSIRSSASGVFPGNYVQLIPPDSEGDAFFTMRRGRLEPPVEEQTAAPASSGGAKHSNDKASSAGGSKLGRTESQRLGERKRYAHSEVKGQMAAPKLRNPSSKHRDRRRSSSLSRLEGQSTRSIQSHDLLPKPIRGRTGKSMDTEGKTGGRQVRLRYVCVVAYPSKGDLELDLKVGDVVVVLKKKSEGWYKGTNETTGKTGVFPASFVQSCASPSSASESRSS